MRLKALLLTVFSVAIWVHGDRVSASSPGCDAYWDLRNGAFDRGDRRAMERHAEEYRACVDGNISRLRGTATEEQFGANFKDAVLNIFRQASSRAPESAQGCDYYWSQRNSALDRGDRRSLERYAGEYQSCLWSVLNQNRFEEGGNVAGYPVKTGKPSNASSTPMVSERSSFSKLPRCSRSPRNNCTDEIVYQPSGDRYLGDFQNDLPEGKGVYFYNGELRKGSRYEGEFRAGRFNGKGVFYFSNRDVYSGLFQDHGPFGRGEYLAVDVADRSRSVVIVGDFRGWDFKGQGVEYSVSGRRLRSGTWDKVGEQWRLFRSHEADTFGVFSFVSVSAILKEAIAQVLSSPDTSAQRGSSPPTVTQATPHQSSLQQASPNPESAPSLPRAPLPVRPNLALSVSASHPDPSGVVTLSITTGVDTGSLRINGDEEGGSNSGRYSLRRFAPIGETKFEIQATDRLGNTQRQIVTVTRAFAETTVRLPALNPTRSGVAKPKDAVAIIIGIEKYRRAPSADFASRDANLFVDYAQRTLGVRPENIRLLADDKAESSEILLTLRSWLPTRVNRDKTDVFVFYSGHGLPSPDGESLFLLPYDVNRDLLDRTAISQKEVIELIAKTNPRSATLFMDACYSGQTRTGETLLASARPISVSAKQGVVPKNFTVFSASAPDQISSSSPEVRHGIFSYFLMRGLEGDADQNKDGQISVAEMQAYLAEQVPRQALSQNRVQRPQVIGDQGRVLVVR